MRLLFICSRNINRSRTAEVIFRNKPQFEVRSAGTDETARITVNAGHIRWADLIFVMEHMHRRMLEQRFSRELSGKSVIVLNIPDAYYFMDDELVNILLERVSDYIEL